MRERLQRARGDGRRVIARLQTALLGPLDPSKSILLVGSGRSGTTWLARLLATLPRTLYLFEPLNPNYVPIARPLYPPGLHTARYLPPRLADPTVERLLRDVLQGRVRNRWTDVEAGAWWPRRLLIKEVRASLMLGYLSDRFDPRVLFITRHPCAVVASRVALQFDGTIRELLMQEALVEDHLSSWVEEISRVREPAEVHAVRWAVESHVARHDLSTRAHFHIFYEDLLLAPQIVLRHLFDWLGEPQPPVSERLLRQPSLSARRDLAYENTRARLMHWQTVLEPETQRLILGWAERFELPWYGGSPFPLTSPLEHPHA